MNTSTITQPELAERILDSFPSGTYLMGTLLRLIDVVETDEVETAAVRCSLQPKLLINPGFVEHWADTPERLLMLVMHELHHVILGHTRLLRRVTAVDNLVFDAVINAMLCRMFPEPAHRLLFTRFYSDAKFPECLLRPPLRWSALGTRVFVPPALEAAAMKPAADVYRALYSPAGATYEELYEILGGSISIEQAEGVPLLGDHSEENGSANGALEGRAPVLLDVVRKIVEQWPQPPNPIKGRSLSDLMSDSTVRTRRRPSNRSVLRGLLRRIGGVHRGNATHRVTDRSPLSVQSPIPTLDRRSIVLRSMGVPTLLYSDTLDAPRRRCGGDRVHVYVDVSGSIGDLKGALYGAVLDCGDFVQRTVHLFSTEVANVSLDELRRGVCRTTGGTDIGCVAEHIARHKVRRAVVITDGFVGRPEGTRRETLERARIGVALTPGGGIRSDLDGVVDHWAQLEEKHEG